MLLFCIGAYFAIKGWQQNDHHFASCQPFIVFKLDLISLPLYMEPDRYNKW